MSLQLSQKVKKTHTHTPWLLLRGYCVQIYIICIHTQNFFNLNNLFYLTQYFQNIISAWNQHKTINDISLIFVLSLWNPLCTTHLGLDQPRQARSSHVRLTATILDSATRAPCEAFDHERGTSTLISVHTHFSPPLPQFHRDIIDRQHCIGFRCPIVGQEGKQGDERAGQAAVWRLAVGSWGRVWFVSIATQPNGLGEERTMKGIKEEGAQPKQPGIWVLSTYQCCKIKGAKMCKTPHTLLGTQKMLNVCEKWKKNLSLKFQHIKN